MIVPFRQSTASQEFEIGPFLDTVGAAVTGLTIANTDIKVWKHGGTTEASKNSGGATHIAAGRYYAVADATDTDTLGGIEFNVHVAGALPCKVRGVVLPAAVFDALYGSGTLPADVVKLLGTAWLTPGTAGTPDVNAKLHGGTAQTGRDIGASVLLSPGTGTGQVVLTAGKVDLSDASILAILSHVLFANYVGNLVSGTTTEFELPGGHPFTTTKTPIGQTIIPYGGTGSRQTARVCSAWDNATSKGLVDPPFSATLGSDTDVLIINTPPGLTSAAVAAAVQALIEAGMLSLVKAKTDLIPTDPADASDITTSFAGVNTKLDAIDDYIDSEIAAIKAKTDLIPAGGPPSATDWSTARAAYLDKLNITGLVAGQNEVLAIQNNTRVRVVVPPALERPDSGSVTYRLYLYLYDSVGNMEAPDSLPVLNAVNQAGTSRNANLSAVTNASAGIYYADYTVSSSHAIEGLSFEWQVVEGGVSRAHGAAALVVDTTAVDFTSADRTDLQTILGRILGTLAAGTHNPQGGDAFARLGAPAGASVSADVAAVKGDSAAIKAKTDGLPADPADASDVAASFATVNTKLDAIDDYVDTELAAIKAKTDNLPASPAAQPKLDTVEAAIVNATYGLAALKVLIDAIDDYVDTEVATLVADLALVKAKTDLIAGAPAVAGDAMALTVAERRAIADQLLIRSQAGSADGGRNLQKLLRFINNKKVRNGLNLDVYDDADSTVLFQIAITTDPNAEPLVTMDPP